MLKLSAGKGFTLQPHEIAVRGARDIEESHAMLEWINGQINQVYERRAQITPRYTGQAGLKVMDLLRLLPMTNCKACGYTTCMAYARGPAGRRDQPQRLPAALGRKIPGETGKAPGLPGKLRLAGPGCGLGERIFMVIKKLCLPGYYLDITAALHAAGSRGHHRPESPGPGDHL